MPPFTRQLNDVRDSSRPVSPGGGTGSAVQSVARTLGQFGQAFSDSRDQQRTEDRQELNDKLSIRADARAQIESDQNVLDQREQDQLDGIQDGYMSSYHDLQMRFEQDGDSTAFALNTRNLMDTSVQQNAGYAEELRDFFGQQGHDTLAFQQTALEEARVEAEVASVASIRASLTEGALAMGLPMDMPQDERDVLVGNQRSAETIASNALSEINLATQILGRDSSVATANRLRQAATYREAESNHTSRFFDTHIAASLPLMGSVNESNLTEVGAGRDAAQRLELLVAEERAAKLSRLSQSPLTREEQDAEMAAFDNYTTVLQDMDDQFGERLQQDLDDLETITSAGLAANTTTLRWLYDAFGPQMLSDPDFAGIGSLPPHYIDLARAETQGATDPNATAALNRARRQPYLNDGREIITNIPADEAAHHYRSSIAEVTQGSSMVLSNTGGALSPESVRVVSDGILGSHSAISAFSNATPDSLTNQASSELTKESTVAAIVALNGDPAYSDEAGNVTSAYRLSLTQLMDIERQNFDRPTTRRSTLFGDTSDQVGFYRLEVNESGMAVPVLRDQVTDESSMVVIRQRENALRAAERYNNLNDALLATDQFSDVAAFREADEPSRRAFHANQGGDLTDAITQEPISPYAESRAVRREQENLHMERLAALENLGVRQEGAPEAPVVPLDTPEEVETAFSPTPTSEVRGIRNNNPGNIEQGVAEWEGLSSDQSGDERFATFDSPEHGIRAFARTLDTYQNTHDLNTIGDIVDRWAPPVENDTTGYAAFVAGEVGVGVDDDVDLSDDKVMASIITAMIQMENGEQPYEEETIRRGIRMAKREEGDG